MSKNLSMLCLLISVFINAVSMEQTAELVPDDIVIPTHWVEMPLEEIRPNGMTETINIRSHFGYSPDTVTSQTLIVFVVIHGSWSSDCQEFFRDLPEDPTKPLKNQNFRHIKRLAAWYATQKEKKLELFSLLWSGKLFDDARFAAADALLRIFTQIDKYQNAEIALIGHSHGCNAANYFTNIIPNDFPPIALLIYFGCPRKKQDYYQPKKYKALLYFYSDSDWITVGGRDDWKSITIGGVGGVGTGLLTLGGAYGGAKAHGLRGAIIGGAAGAGVGTAGTVLVFKYCMDGTNEFKPLDCAVTIGFRLKFDGSNPGHGAITNVAEWLPELVEKIMEKYTYHYLYSQQFHANIDTSDNADNPIYLVLMPTNAPDELPEEEIEFASLVDGDILVIANGRKKRAESDFSKSEARRYLELYKKNIHENDVTDLAWF